MKLQVILILACIYAVTGNAVDKLDSMAYHMSRAFEVSREKIRSCMDKTRITMEDFETFPRTLDDLGQNPERAESERRSLCLLACIAQEEGLMIGSKLQITKIHDELNRRIVEDKRKPMILAAVDSCADVAKNLSDECQVGLQFIKCIHQKAQLQVSNA